MDNNVIVTRKISRQADSQQLKVALQELKLSKELCNQLTSEREENEKILYCRCKDIKTSPFAEDEAVPKPLVLAVDLNPPSPLISELALAVPYPPFEFAVD
ncbi:unnamed protein product [Leptidea sinapis]|uniref:Uncharacterized protein n=1 Tax=Leptidea sinapis TaxID=189913 RepID=A0A5E4QFR9_9NEOP|nr:unnamed protein product [Leptidea sinapis]